MVEVVYDYGDGLVFRYVSTVESRDGKTWRDTSYYAEPFEASEWRAQWPSTRIEAVECRIHDGTPVHYAKISPRGRKTRLYVASA